ncbi:MAG: XdhC family protein, partial [Deltaproteobacteria bacterium]|nr:XdhC family protein [Deltaproteobacteria bacterium]
GTVGGGHFEKVVTGAAVAALGERRPRRLAVHLTRDLGMCCGGAMEVFIEPIAPVETLVIFGAGHVARPTALFAREAGWRVRVIDEREDWATAERFPGCELIVADPRLEARSLVPSPTTYAVVLTHDHALDQDLVEILLPGDFPYVGLIGSKTKVARFGLRLRAAGLSPEVLGRLRSPVGLDIGAETPAEIALAIVGEMVRARRRP